MTNKLFIVKYVFVDDVDAKIIVIFDINLNKRESFDDIDRFEATFAQNICFFDVAKNVASKIKKDRVNSMKINKIIESVEDEVSDEVKNDFENDCENVFDVAKNIKFEAKVSFVVKTSKNVDLNFF